MSYNDMAYYHAPLRESRCRMYSTIVGVYSTTIVGLLYYSRPVPFRQIYSWQCDILRVYTCVR